MKPITDRSGVHVAHGRHGRGVFSSRRFEAGEIVEVCPVLEVPAADITGPLRDYIFDSATDEEAAVLLLGYGMLYNHSAEPNVEYGEHDDDTVAFETIRRVEAGEELTIDYGTQWWSDRGLEPD